MVTSLKGPIPRGMSKELPSRISTAIWASDAAARNSDSMSGAGERNREQAGPGSKIHDRVALTQAGMGRDPVYERIGISEPEARVERNVGPEAARIEGRLTHLRLVRIRFRAILATVNTNWTMLWRRSHSSTTTETF